MTTPWDPEPPTPPARDDDPAAPPTWVSSPAAAEPTAPAPAPVAPVPPAPPAYRAPTETSAVPTAAPTSEPPVADAAGADYARRVLDGQRPEAATTSFAPVPPIDAAATPPEGMPRFVGAAQGPSTLSGAAPAGPPLRPEPAPYWGAGAVPPTPPPASPVPPAGRARKGRGWVAVAAVVGAFALLTAGYLGRDAVDRDSSKSAAIAGTNTSTTAGTQNTTPLVQNSGDEPAVAVAKALSPAVVQIQTQEGLGSGVVYDASGLIVTNQHVVGTAKTVQVNLSDGTKLQGTVQGADPTSDIAVVKIEVDAGKTLTVAKLADTAPNVGSVAVAIGSPFGLTGTVTAGIVSAVDRPVENAQNVSVHMIQTVAPSNPGNSGGALANRNAEVIGINAEIYSQSGENNGIGFAIPIQTAKTIADEITSGKLTSSAPVERATLGVSIQASPNGDSGAWVANVVSGSAADKAGLQAGDLIVGIDGQQMTSADDLSKAITGHKPGDKITLSVVRDGKTGDVSATLGTSG